MNQLFGDGIYVFTLEFYFGRRCERWDGISQDLFGFLYQNGIIPSVTVNISCTSESLLCASIVVISLSTWRSVPVSSRYYLFNKMLHLNSRSCHRHSSKEQYSQKYPRQGNICAAIDSLRWRGNCVGQSTSLEMVYATYYQLLAYNTFTQLIYQYWFNVAILRLAKVYVLEVKGAQPQ